MRFPGLLIDSGWSDAPASLRGSARQTQVSAPREVDDRYLAIQHAEAVNIACEALAERAVEEGVRARAHHSGRSAEAWATMDWV